MAAQRRATSVNLLRAEEVAFSLFSLGFLSCVTARDDPWAGILLFPGRIKPIECVGWKRPFNHPFPQNPDHYCSFWGSNQGGFYCSPWCFHPSGGPVCCWHSGCSVAEPGPWPWEALCVYGRCGQGLHNRSTGEHRVPSAGWRCSSTRDGQAVGTRGDGAGGQDHPLGMRRLDPRDAEQLGGEAAF